MEVRRSRPMRESVKGAAAVHMCQDSRAAEASGIGELPRHCGSYGQTSATLSRDQAQRLIQTQIAHAFAVIVEVVRRPFP